MTNLDTVARKLNMIIAGLERKPERLRARLGDGKGVVQVSGRNGYVHISLEDGSYFGVAFNAIAPLVNNLPVIVGYSHGQPELFQVLESGDYNAVLSGGLPVYTGPSGSYVNVNLTLNNGYITSISNGATGQNYHNIVIVDPVAGVGDYTTLTAALAAITDAGVANRYGVVITPGVYTDYGIILKDCVDIMALVPGTVLFKPASGLSYNAILKMVAGSAPLTYGITVTGLRLELPAGSSGSSCLDIAQGGALNATFRSCEFVSLETSSAGNTSVAVYAWSSGCVTFDSCLMDNRVASGIAYGNYFYNSSSGVLILKHCYLVVVSTSTNSRVIDLYGGSTSLYHCQLLGGQYSIYRSGGTNTVTASLVYMTAPYQQHASLTVTGGTVYVIKALEVATDTLTVSADTAETNTAHETLKLEHATSGTVAAGFGVRQKFALESSTTADQEAAAIDVLWTDPAHANRTALLRGQTTGNAANTGYFGHWNYSAVADTAITIIPNAIGDVTEIATFMYAVAEVTGAGTGGGVVTLTPNGGAVTLYSDGTDTLQITCASDGSVTIVRSAGSDTFKVSLWGTWL